MMAVAVIAVTTFAGCISWRWLLLVLLLLLL